MRALVVTNIPNPYNDALFRALARQPLDLKVAYCAAIEPNRSWQLATDKGYDYMVLPGFTRWVSLQWNPAIFRVLRGLRPEVAILGGSYTMPTFQAAAFSLHFLGIPWLYWGEELDHHPTSPVRRASRWLLRRSIRSAHGVLAIGRRACASYQRIGIPACRIANFHYYADTEHFRWSPAARQVERSRVRNALRLSPTDTVSLFCGQLIHRKGIDTLLKALAQAGDGAGTVVLIGDGPEEGRFRSLAETLGVADRVRFAGFVQPVELPAYFAAADALVLPSRQEGWGVVVSEALAAGLPVIASDRVNAAVELVADGESGYIFPVEDSAALAAILRRFAGEPQIRMRLSEQASAGVARETPAFAAGRLAEILAAVQSDADIGGL